MVLNLLDKLEEIEGKYGMAGTIFGIVIIVTCIILSLFAIKLIMDFNFKVIDWVCRNLWGFKFF